MLIQLSCLGKHYCRRGLDRPMNNEHPQLQAQTRYTGLLHVYSSCCVWLIPAGGAQTYTNRPTLCPFWHCSTQTGTIKKSDSLTAILPLAYSTSQAKPLHQTQRAAWNLLNDTLNSGGPLPQPQSLTLLIDHAVNLTSWCWILYVFELHMCGGMPFLQPGLWST